MNRGLVFGLLIFLLFGCQDQTQTQNTSSVGSPAASAPESSAPPKEYQLVGEIVSVDRTAKKATIKHEKIEGYMAEMTMSYPIPDQADLDKIKEGDHITATVYDSEADSRYWIGKIEVQVGEPAAK